MGNEWKETTLGETVREGGGLIQTGPFGSQLHASDYVEDVQGIPCIMPANIIDNKVNYDGIARISNEDAQRLKKHLVKTGDIVYSRRGDVTRKALITESDEGAFCGTGCLLIRPGSEVDSKFLHYHLSSPFNSRWIVHHAIGATMPNLNTGILSNIPLSIPSADTQRRIAHILGSLDDKIALNRQQNATLEAMAQALFRSWFVDFDPVLDKALAAGHDIPEPLQPKAQRRLALGDKRKPLPPEVTGLFPDRFVYEEEVGWVPEGWVVKPAKEIYDISIGKTPPRKEPEWFSLDESNISWVSIRDMGNAEIFISSTSEYLTEEAVEKFRVVRVPKGSVILSFKLTIGRVAIAGSDLCTNEAIAHFKANSRSPGQFWTYLYLKDFNFDSLGSTSSIATAINSKIVKSMPIVVCGIDILDAFNEEVKPIFEKIAVNVDQVRNLVKLRDTLLPKLMSGELQVNG
jgi:type I restriction enzyme S subunit